MTIRENQSPMSALSRWMGRSGTAFLRKLPAESAHIAGMWLLNSGALKYLPSPKSQRADVELSVSIPGIGRLKHPIGLAAGFDKNCYCPHGFASLGFSMLEVGTVTPFAQAGNPKPRLFRQPEQCGIINRMGFNNDGAKAVAARIADLHWEHQDTPLGINLGKNKNTPLDRALDDYIESYQAFRGLCRYYVINLSSPNTPGLRDLANTRFLTELSEAFSDEEKGVWVKLDPDMPKQQFQSLVEVITDRGFPGIILTNTHRVDWPKTGGQSGHPLAVTATKCLEWAWEVHRGQLPMIGCGGILSGADIFEKIIRGASAVQIYTALVYRGPWVVGELLDELAAEMSLRGIQNIEDAYGIFYN